MDFGRLLGRAETGPLTDPRELFTALPNKAKGFGYLPFWAWADRRVDVAAILHQHRDDDEFRFTYPMVADVLSISTAVVGSGAVEIRPPFPPVGSVAGFAEARRRIYLTATLPDDSVLVSHFDAAPEPQAFVHEPTLSSAVSHDNAEIV